MKLRYKPEGGRFGYGFDYFCAECGEYVGNSSHDKVLEHSVTHQETRGWIRKRTVTVEVNCSNAGKKCAIPKHEIEASELPGGRG